MNGKEAVSLIAAIRKKSGSRRSRVRGNSLKKSAFVRLLLITFAAVILFYAIGLSINIIGIQHVRNDLQDALQTHARYAADQLTQDLRRLEFFMMEMLSDKQLLRFAFSHEILTDWERQSYIKTLSSQEYLIKRSSDLVESIQIMFPAFQKTIITAQAQYADLNQDVWDQLFSRAERGRVTIAEWDGNLWLLLPRFDGSSPLLMIAFSITPDRLSARVAQLCAEPDQGMLLLREDGTVLAATGNGNLLYENRDHPDRNLLSADAALPFFGLGVRSYAYIDEALEPFVHYRRTLWVLTVLALGLLVTYLWYFRRFILRPLNNLFDSMRQVEADGKYRISASEQDADYNDVYAQFNHMVDHLEHLSEQVYEERYRAQRAELRQLQMQIDPHFLYNTLYLIYRVARADGNSTIAHLSLNLSNYYRYITKMPEQVVPLREEIAHVNNYLEIQRVRFEPRIRIHVDPLPEEIAEEPIPSLIIQPIVENAFQHGVRDLDSGGVISLTYEVTPDLFRVIVSDNSGKMTPAEVEKLWQRLNGPETESSSALRNLYRRLQIYEGADQVLELRSVDNGLCATLTFRKKERRI